MFVEPRRLRDWQHPGRRCAHLLLGEKPLKLQLLLLMLLLELKSLPKQLLFLLLLEKYPCLLPRFLLLFLDKQLLLLLLLLLALSGGGGSNSSLPSRLLRCNPHLGFNLLQRPYTGLVKSMGQDR